MDGVKLTRDESSVLFVNGLLVFESLRRPSWVSIWKRDEKEESRRQEGRVSWKSKCLGIIYWSFHARQARLVSRDILNVTSPNKKWSETEDIDKNSLFWLWTSEFHKAFLLKFFRINLIVWIYFFFCLFLFF